MEYHIALSPDLGLSSNDFALAWEETQSASSVAAIHQVPTVGKSYLDSDTLTLILTTLSSVGVGVVTNAIYDVLKAAFIKQGNPQKHIKTTILKQPGGTELIVIEEQDS